MRFDLSRRTFLKTAGVTAASTYVAKTIPSWGMSAEKNLVAVVPPLATFAYSDVQLLDGPMKRQFEQNHARFLNLEDDRLLKVFRQAAGLPAPGEDMGGWYDIGGFSLIRNDFHGFIPGHSFGQYLSALARACAVTGDEPTRAKVNRLVKGYAETLDPQAKFFVDYRLPAYTYDKLSCGLIDAHQFAKDPMAMDVHERLTRAIVAYLPEKALSRQEQRSRPHKDTSYTWDETYTLPENLFLAYQRSGKSLYRDMGRRYLEDDTYFNPLAEGNNVLPFEHAYSHVNAFSSAMQAYITLGSEKHLRAAKNGFEMLLTTQSFATGGWGPDESFGEPERGQLGDSLSSTHASFEGLTDTLKSPATCCAPRKIPSMATAWSACFTTRFSERGRSRPMAPRSIIPTMRQPERKSGTDRSGRVARERSLSSPPIITSAPTSALRMAST
jgi:uncharacterized protein